MNSHQYVTLSKVYSGLNKNADVLLITPAYNKSNAYLENLYEGLDTEIMFFKTSNIFVLWLKFFFNRRKGILHHHWFHVDRLVELPFNLWKLIIMQLFQLIGFKLVWTVHNLQPHSKKFISINQLLRNKLAKVADAVLVHGISDVTKVSRLFNIDKLKIHVVAHPHYKVAKLNVEEAKKVINKQYLNIGELSSNELKFIVFGQVAPYKGIVELVDFWIKNNLTSYLIIVGGVKSINEDYGRNLSERIQHADQIIWLNNYIPIEDVGAFFSYADYVLFNYNEILTSGGVILAKSYMNRVIAPNKGNIFEYLSETDFLFENEIQLREIIQGIENSNNK